MIQPCNILTPFTDLSEQAVYGRFWDGCIFPLLANKKRLLPFQVKRTKTGDAITIFELIGITTIDLMTDVGKINIYDFNTFEQIIYNVTEDLSTSITDGKYYIKLGDGTNIWYFDWMDVASYNSTYITYGEFTTEFSYEFLREEFTDVGIGYCVLNFKSTKDFGNKINQFNYQDILIMDSRNLCINIFKGNKEEIILSEDTGQEVIERIYYYNQWLLTFYHNKNVAKFLAKLSLIDSLYITLPDGSEIMPNEFEAKIEDTDNDLVKKIEITYKTDYFEKSECIKNFEL